MAGVITKALATATKALPFPGWGGGYSWGWNSAWGGRFPSFRGLPGQRDWAKILGDGSSNSIVEACVLWICRNFPEAPLIVVEEDAEGINHIMRKHPFPKLWKRPNPFMSGTLLTYALLNSFIVDGNAYLLKRRNSSGRIAELWYVPHWMIQPRWSPNGETYIDYYDYIVQGIHYPVAIEDVFHLRYGLDPENTRLGRSPLRTLFKELGVDEEASTFSASLLHNLGVPGVVLSPDKETRGVWDENKREAIKAKFTEEYSGENRGKPIVMSKPTNLSTFGFNPSEMDLSSIRDVPEERVTAVLGIPASVVGFQQQNSKVGATRSEERDQAYENCIIPTQKILGDEMSVQMLWEFAKSDEELETQSIAFDLSKVRVLLDAQGKLAERMATIARSGIAKRKEARATLGLSVGPEDDIYIPSPGVQELNPDGSLVNPQLAMPGRFPGQKPPQLALPSGKSEEELATERKEREDREQKRDELLVSSIKVLTDGMLSAVKAMSETQHKSVDFDVLHDETGRFTGIRSAAAAKNGGGN